MEAVCKTCNLSLKLPAAALPAGAKLYCPKCSKALEISGERPKAPAPVSAPPAAPPASTFQSAYQTAPAAPVAPVYQPPYQSQPVVPPPPAPAPADPSAGAGGSWDSFLSGAGAPQAAPAAAPSYPPPVQVGLGIPVAVAPSDRLTVSMMPAVVVPQTPAAPPAPARPATATEQLFSEDIVPDTEGAGEEVDQARKNLFVKADNVWYGAPEDAPATLPPSGPPKIPQGQGPQQVGYIKATESIQVDPSLFQKQELQAPSPVPQKPATTSGVDSNSAGGGRMELDLGGGGSSSLELAVTTPPHPSVSPMAPPSLDLDGKPHAHHAAAPRHASGPIRLVSTTPKKAMNITVPAIIVAVLLVSAGALYLFAGHTSTKEKFDMAAANNPRTGVLPSTSSAALKPSTVKPDEKPAEPAKDDEKGEAPEAAVEKGAKVAKKAAGASSPREKDKDDAKPTAGGAAPKDTGKKAAQEHYSLGNQYFMQQRFDMSAEEYKAAVRADASYAYAYRGLGAAYARLGKADLAVKQYEMYIKLVPGAPDAEQVKKIINDYYGK